MSKLWNWLKNLLASAAAAGDTVAGVKKEGLFGRRTRQVGKSSGSLPRRRNCRMTLGETTVHARTWLRVLFALPAPCLLDVVEASPAFTQTVLRNTELAARLVSATSLEIAESWIVNRSWKRRGGARWQFCVLLRDGANAAAKLGDVEALKSCLENERRAKRRHPALRLQRLCYTAASKGHVECLRFLHETAPREEGTESAEIWDESICDAAARAGSVECLEYARTHGCPWGHNAVSLAALAGSCACMDYVYRNSTSEDPLVWSSFVCVHAAQSGSLPCMRYAKERGCSWVHYVTRYAAGAGSMGCLEFAHTNGCSWDPQTCSSAARARSLACLRYAHENGCAWDASVCACAARAGSLECLSYAHENGCPWGPCTTHAAAESGHLDCLVYAHTHGCPWDETVCEAACKANSVGCLAYAREHGCPWPDQKLCCVAAENGAFACLKFTHGEGAPLGTSLLAAARRGSFECVVYAYEKATRLCSPCSLFNALLALLAGGTEWRVGEPLNAQARGLVIREDARRLLSLRYLIRRILHAYPAYLPLHKPQQQKACFAAAASGYLSCLHHLCLCGFEWDSSVCEAAALQGSLDCLQYAIETGCPADIQLCLELALSRGNVKCALYLQSRMPARPF